jgi:predicted amino acid-binding ACT domain protein
VSAIPYISVSQAVFRGTLGLVTIVEITANDTSLNMFCQLATSVVQNDV